MDHSQKKTYLFSIDALRVIAILGVILIHISTKTLATLHLDVTLNPFSFFLNQTARFAVPLFFLISGFVLELNYKEKLSYVNFFKKRAGRIILPFLFWSTIYFIFAPEYGIEKITSFYFIGIVMQGMSAYHLYFIPTLILFYLAFPLLHKAVNFLKNPYILIVIFFVQTYLLTIDYYVKPFKFQYDLRIAVLSFSMFIAGMVASHFKDGIYLFVKRYFIFVLSLFLIILPVIFYHSYTLLTLTRNYHYMYSQYHPLNYFYTLVLSVLFFYILEKTQFARRFFISLSRLSFFVFFIHVLVQYIIWDNVVVGLISVFGLNILENFWFDPLMFSIIATISFTLAFFAHKLPWAPKITG